MKRTFFYILFFISYLSTSQDKNSLRAIIGETGKTIEVEQTFSYTNTSNNSLVNIALNDWNYALATKKSALAGRFSDEYNRSFHLSKKKEQANTFIHYFKSETNEQLQYTRLKEQPDILIITLDKPLLPNEKLIIHCKYTLTLPDAKFTKFGYYNENKIYLHNCFLSICSFKDGKFMMQSEENLDDLTPHYADHFIELQTSNSYSCTSDLEVISTSMNTTKLEGKNRGTFTLILEKNNSYTTFKHNTIEVATNLEFKQLSDLEKRNSINKIIDYANSKLGFSTQKKIIVSKEMYDREPFYGLNELPSFLAPFNDNFVFELQFLKTYLNNFLTANLKVNLREEHWIIEGIQHYYIKKYIDTHYPNTKAFGKLAEFKLLKGYKLITMNFTEQFLYNYLLMARKNLDQPIGNDKNKLIKFNEKIAGKFKAGLVLNYLSLYIGEDNFEQLIRECIGHKTDHFYTRNEFLSTFENQTHKNLNWFKQLLNNNEFVDFKINNINRNNNIIKFDVLNTSKSTIPIQFSLYKNEKIVEKFTDTIAGFKKFSFDKNKYDYFIINEEYSFPELNARNNYLKFNKTFFENKPIKFTFFKDIEDPKYNQFFFVPTAEYNLYDGILLGIKINNRSILDKNFTFDFTPNFSTKTQTLAGSTALNFNNYYKNSTLFNIRYGIGLTRLHYLPDAFYTKITPSLLFRFRNPDLRKNEGQSLLFRQIYVNRQVSAFQNQSNQENYSVFNARYNYSKSELIQQFNYGTDLQIGNSFGKISGSIQYRKLFENNRYITLRGFGGLFMYNDTASNYFSFGLDRPSDYLFDYPLLGRSENNGIYSQQFVYGEGGFKSKFNQRFANQYMFTLNASFNIWNWIEIYGDIGTFKNSNLGAKYVYDSGIHLNLVQDYFELFFPVYSSNGYELNSKNYGEKIRFVITLSPKILTSLFTRRWF